MQKFDVNGQSVPKIEWKQTDGRTGGDRITSLANAVGTDRMETNGRTDGADGITFCANGVGKY